MVGKTSAVETPPEVIIGTPIHRRGAFILDKFLSNQKEIQKECPSCSLVLACNENELDFADELKQHIQPYDLKAEVITHKSDKPSYTKEAKFWNIASTRESLRKYALSVGARYLLFLDADMAFDPTVVNIMKGEIQGADVVYSGYHLASELTTGYSAAGCLMLERHILSKISFRCYELRSGDVLSEDAMLSMDLFACHAKVKKGAFVSIKHYRGTQEYWATEPHIMSYFKRITNNALVRYMLMKVSILLGYDVPYRLLLRIYGRLPEKYR